MSTLVIHFGAHKTATSSLQAVLQRSRSKLSKLGINYISTGTLNDSGIVPALHRCPRTRDEANAVRSVFEGALRANETEHYGDEPRRVIVSHESLLSHCLLEPGRKFFYPTTVNALEKLRAYGVFDLFDAVELVYFVRRQDRFLASLYMENFHWRAWMRPFPEVVERTDCSLIDWLAFCEQVEALTQDCKFHVAPFELLQARGAAGFLREYLRLMLGEDSVELGTLPHSNQGFSKIAFAVASRVNSMLILKNRQLLKGMLRRNFPAPRFGQLEIVDEETASAILRVHRESNAKLFEKYMPQYADLKHLYVSAC